MKAVIVMLYGIPTDPLTNPDYKSYFRSVLGNIERDGGNAHIYVGGGSTDPFRAALTEAEFAEKLFLHLGVPQELLHSCPHGLDAREALECLAQIIPDDGRPIRIYCAWTHQDLVRYQAQEIFGASRVDIVPLTYPTDLSDSASVAVRVARIPRYLLGRLGRRFVPIRVLEIRLRELFMYLAAEEARERHTSE